MLFMEEHTDSINDVIKVVLACHCMSIYTPTHTGTPPTPPPPPPKFRLVTTVADA